MGRVITVIPSRISSTRLFQKPLIDIQGKTLIRRVYENALKLQKTDLIVVATDSNAVVEEISAAGGKAVLTPSELQSGSDRVSYIIEKYYPDAEIVVNLQGDEPFISTELIDDVIAAMHTSDDPVSSLYFPIKPEIALDESAVKVVLDKNSYAIYFSRSAIPYGADTYYKHLGVYIWKSSVLKEFSRLQVSDLELKERLEQLRLIDNGYRIKMYKSPADTIGIDTEEDVKSAQRLLERELV